MDDLISRQAVINAIENTDAKMSMKEWDEITDAVMGVPSAKPEINRCKDCKYGSPNGKYGCKCYHYRLYETHDMKPEDFCSRAERRADE